MKKLLRSERGEVTFLVLAALYLVSMLIFAISQGSKSKQKYLNEGMAKTLVERFESVSTKGEELTIQLKNTDQCHAVKNKMIDMSEGDDALADIKFKLSCNREFLTYKH